MRVEWLTYADKEKSHNNTKIRLLAIYPYYCQYRLLLFCVNVLWMEKCRSWSDGNTFSMDARMPSYASRMYYAYVVCRVLEHMTQGATLLREKESPRKQPPVPTSNKQDKSIIKWSNEITPTKQSFFALAVCVSIFCIWRTPWKEAKLMGAPRTSFSSSKFTLYMSVDVCGCAVWFERGRIAERFLGECKSLRIAFRWCVFNAAYRNPRRLSTPSGNFVIILMFLCTPQENNIWIFSMCVCECGDEGACMAAVANTFFCAQIIWLVWHKRVVHELESHVFASPFIHEFHVYFRFSSITWKCEYVVVVVFTFGFGISLAQRLYSWPHRTCC